MVRANRKKPPWLLGSFRAARLRGVQMPALGTFSPSRTCETAEARRKATNGVMAKLTLMRTYLDERCDVACLPRDGASVVTC